ncbi:MAG: hypothetical protein IPP82_06650 [Xanthomonadales bacterium]|nr:hypothetical protein [Xanthomonadales bacterium]
MSLIEPTPISVDGLSIPAQANFSYQMGLMTFPATVGQRLELGVIVPITANFISNSFFSNWVRVSVFDPLGVRVGEVPACESLTGTFYSSSYFEAGCAVTIRSAPVAGNYTVVVRDIHPSFPVEEPIQFIATVSTPRQMTTTIDSPPVWLNLNRPGQAGIVGVFRNLRSGTFSSTGSCPNSSVYFPLTAYQPNGSVLLVSERKQRWCNRSADASSDRPIFAGRECGCPKDLRSSVELAGIHQHHAIVQPTCGAHSDDDHIDERRAKSRCHWIKRQGRGCRQSEQWRLRRATRHGERSAQSQSAFCIFDLSRTTDACWMLLSPV